MQKENSKKRETTQKKLILCCLSNGANCKIDGHHHSHDNDNCLLSAEEIEENLFRHGHKVGIATVYRVLRELCESGLVRRYTLPEGSAKYRYVGEENGGVELLCRECGCIIDTHDDSVNKALQNLSENYGFSLSNESAVLFGKCNKCNNKGV